MPHEHEILARAIRRLPELLPVLRNWRFKTNSAASHGDDAIDLLATGQLGTKTLRFAIEVQGVGEPRPVRQAIAHLRAYIEHAQPTAYPIVVAPYISPRVAGLCAAGAVGYFDLSGNACLRYRTILVRDEGHPNIFRRHALQRSVFSKKASRIILALLEHPDKVWDQKALAGETRTSHAHVHKVIAALVEQDLVDRPPRGPIKLTNAPALLDFWRDRYSLKRHRLLRFFRLTRSGPELMRKLASDLERMDIRFAFTQAAGASLVSPYTTFAVVALYADCDPNALERVPELRAVDSGPNVLIYLPEDPGIFDYPAKTRPYPVVSKAQLYLDLFHSGGRGRDAAQWLREKLIGF